MQRLQRSGVQRPPPTQSTCQDAGQSSRPSHLTSKQTILKSTRSNSYSTKWVLVLPRSIQAICRMVSGGRMKNWNYFNWRINFSKRSVTIVPQVFEILSIFCTNHSWFLGTTLVTYLAAKMNTATNRIACKFVNKPAMLRVRLNDFSK